MNIIDAMKSGKMIRRRGRQSWSSSKSMLFSGETQRGYLCDASQGHWLDPGFYLETIGPDKEDILADDWEVEEQAVMIRPSQFHSAWEKALATCLEQERETRCHIMTDFGREVMRNLGLGDP